MQFALTDIIADKEFPAVKWVILNRLQDVDSGETFYYVQQHLTTGVIHLENSVMIDRYFIKVE